MSDLMAKSHKPTLQFWLVVFFLALVFATGGSSRGDVQSLLILSPASVIFCGFALWSLRFEHVKENRLMVIGASAVIVLALIHLIPIPPGLWELLGRSTDIVSVQAQTGTIVRWKSFTPVTSNGWQSALALTTPLVVVLFGIQLRQIDIFRLLPVVIVLFSISAFIGLLQIISDPNGSLYFYRITNNGSAVGLFANRNHAATLLGCLFPILAVYASIAKRSIDEQRGRQLWCGLIAVVIIPLILITGSRSGLIAAVLGLAGGSILYRTTKRGNSNKLQGRKKAAAIVPVAEALALAGLVSLTYWLSRAEAVERLFLFASEQNLRADFVGAAMGLFSKYYLAGIGSGSFAEFYQIAEPVPMLNSTRLNRVHNDWVEFAVTFGLPGLTLLGLFIVFYLIKSYRLWWLSGSSRYSIIVGRMAGMGIAILAIASLSDYPLRTPTMMSVLALFTLWFVKEISPSKQVLDRHLDLSNKRAPLH